MSRAAAQAAPGRVQAHPARPRFYPGWICSYASDIISLIRARASRRDCEAEITVKKKNVIIIIAAFLLFAAALIGWRAWSDMPERRAARFVAQNGPAFSELLDSGEAIPEAFDGATVGVWNGEHLMYELLLGSGIGERQYWGVYYSPDDVPLPFQNTDAPLLENGEDSWTWRAEGDNHGTTQRIAPKWYYFEASL